MFIHFHMHNVFFCSHSRVFFLSIERGWLADPKMTMRSRGGGGIVDNMWDCVRGLNNSLRSRLATSPTVVLISVDLIISPCKINKVSLS